MLGSTLVSGQEQESDTAVSTDSPKIGQLPSLVIFLWLHSSTTHFPPTELPLTPFGVNSRDFLERKSNTFVWHQQPWHSPGWDPSPSHLGRGETNPPPLMFFGWWKERTQRKPKQTREEQAKLWEGSNPSSWWNWLPWSWDVNVIHCDTVLNSLKCCSMRPFILR